MLIWSRNWRPIGCQNGYQKWIIFFVDFLMILHQFLKPFWARFLTPKGGPTNQLFAPKIASAGPLTSKTTQVAPKRAQGALKARIRAHPRRFFGTQKIPTDHFLASQMPSGGFQGIPGKPMRPTSHPALDASSYACTLKMRMARWRGLPKAIG